MRNAKALAALCMVALLAPFALRISAQDGKPLSADEKPTISTTVHLVMTPVTVTDRAGNVVNNLAPRDFRLTDNGKVQAITEDVAVHPISMVIAVQANAEVEKMLPAVQKMGAAIQSQILGDDGEAAVIEFDHRIQTLGDFTSDPDKLAMALKKLKPGSRTSRLNDATIRSVDLLKSRPNTRRRILLLIAESRDNGSELKARSR